MARIFDAVNGLLQTDAMKAFLTQSAAKSAEKTFQKRYETDS